MAIQSAVLPSGSAVVVCRGELSCPDLSGMFARPAPRPCFVGANFMFAPPAPSPWAVGANFPAPIYRGCSPGRLMRAPPESQRDSVT